MALKGYQMKDGKSEPKKTDPKKARLKAGLTPEALAAKVPCGVATVFRCEAGRRWPRHTALRRAYLAALGLSDQT